MTVFWSIKGSPYTDNLGYSDIPLTSTLFGRPNTVTEAVRPVLTQLHNSYKRVKFSGPNHYRVLDILGYYTLFKIILLAWSVFFTKLLT